MILMNASVANKGYLQRHKFPESAKSNGICMTNKKSNQTVMIALHSFLSNKKINLYYAINRNLKCAMETALGNVYL